jgi:hypothetical protein
LRGAGLAAGNKQIDVDRAQIGGTHRLNFARMLQQFFTNYDFGELRDYAEMALIISPDFNVKRRPFGDLVREIVAIMKRHQRAFRVNGVAMIFRFSQMRHLSV